MEYGMRLPFFWRVSEAMSELEPTDMKELILRNELQKEKRNRYQNAVN